MKYTCKIIVTREYMKKIVEKLNCGTTTDNASCTVALIKTTWGDLRLEMYLPDSGITDADATIDVFTSNPIETLEYTLDKIVKQKPLKIL